MELITESSSEGAISYHNTTITMLHYEIDLKRCLQFVAFELLWLSEVAHFSSKVSFGVYILLKPAQSTCGHHLQYIGWIVQYLLLQAVLDKFAISFNIKWTNVLVCSKIIWIKLCLLNYYAYCFYFALLHNKYLHNVKQQISISKTFLYLTYWSKYFLCWWIFKWVFNWFPLCSCVISSQQSGLLLIS